jgi:hypothetical protein
MRNEIEENRETSSGRITASCLGTDMHEYLLFLCIAIPFIVIENAENQIQLDPENGILYGN